ncbi:TRAP dicarboxylate transporterDctQ subunit, unknown substrate 6 [Bosea sp. BIWAKO-01]|nr:TRAP dicarboxylate transporterDctQ subunit, unknown substrate 6 [Bosea sp. BIWAKO-01]
MFKLWLALATVGGMAACVGVAWTFCRQLLPLARFIDAIGEYLGVVASWLVLLACLVSAGNATIRYLISNSSNAWLELQWYMFGGMVLLGAAYTLKVNEHVRVDLIYGMVSDRTRHWIDLLGGAVFLMPMCLIMIWFTWPWFWQSWVLNESSNNAGGLVRWPIKLLLPVGFGLILLQGISEMIKRAAALRGFHQHEYAYEKPLQ